LPKFITDRLRGLFTKHPEAGAGLATLVVFGIFSWWGENFLTTYSLNTMLFVVAEWGIIALGFTLLMISGEFDLSVGSVLALCGVLAIVMLDVGLPPLIAVVMTLIIGVAIGLLHGFIVVKLGVPSFIVTLAAMLFWRGVILIITDGFPIALGGLMATEKPDFFQIFSYRFENAFSISVIWFVVVAVMLGFILHRTRFGNWIFATGGNKLAAIQAGVPVNRVKLMLFGLTSGLASLAGIIQMTRYGSVDPLRGELLELRAIAAIVVGGTLLMGGYGSILGTVFGVLLIAIVRQGLVLTQAPQMLFESFVGLLIVIAVIINTMAQRRALGVRDE
jgi:simple sugar transport system permease protein